MTDVIYSKIGIGGNSFPGADYSGVSTWAAGSQSNSLTDFHVGIVRGNLSLSWDDALQDSRFAYHNFLLIHTTGMIIAWNYGEARGTFEPALKIDSTEANWDSVICLNAISEFLRAHFIPVSSEVSSEYVDLNFHEKINVIIPSLETIDASLISWLAEHPEYLHSLHWRKFEELLDVLFRDQGFESQLGPGGGDGGVDLRLVQRSDIGDLLFLVQAKKYAPHRKIDLVPVHALYASVADERANKGIFVSTAEFLPSTRQYAERNRYLIELAGPEKILSWLREHGRH